MAMSLRSYGNCIGYSGGFSLRSGMFGYKYSPPWPSSTIDPPKPSFFPKSLSLATQLQRLEQQYFNLAVIRVGASPDPALDWWDETKERTVDAALQLVREIYARAGFGIGRITRWAAPADAPTSVANSPWLDVWGVSSGSNLVEDFTVDRNVINVFFVPALDHAGHTPYGEAGAIVQYIDSAMLMGRTTAHEIGHILIRGLGDVAGALNEGLGSLLGRDELVPDPGFLDHSSNSANLMAQTKDAATIPGKPGIVDIENSVYLDAGQRKDIRHSRWVVAPCTLTGAPEAESSGPPPSPPSDS
jgi:hypothetical protein